MVLANRVWSILGGLGLLAWSGQAMAGMAPANFGAMYNFAAQGKINVLKNAVDRGMDIDSVNHNGFTGLCVAIYRQDYAAFKVFKSLGADVRHSCVKKIPKERYEAFVNGASGQRAYAQRYAGGGAAAGGYRQDYGNYQHNRVSQGRFGHVDYNPDDEPLISSDTAWTIGGVALVAGGIAVALSGGGGSDDDNPEASIISGLHGVPGAPYNVADNINKNVLESSSADQSRYWGVYNPDNKNIINRKDITVNNITTNPDDNKDHWGGIFAENGYVYNTGDINIISSGKYGKGIMSCVVSVYNPDNTACIVNAANPVAGDIYNAGNITIAADQSMGIFSSTTNQITNSGKITMTGDNNSGIWVLGKGNVTNNGQIILTGTNDTFLAGAMTAVWISEGGNIVNNGEIKVTSAGSGGIGVYTKDGSISNNGKITLSGGGTAVKVYKGDVTNNGSIEVEGSGGIGIKVDNSGKVVNNNNIKVTNGTAGIKGAGDEIINAKGAIITTIGSGTGILTDGNVTNNGMINAAGAGISGAEVTNSETGMIIAGSTGISGSTVTNDGIIEASTGISASSLGINNGTITSKGTAMNGGTSGSLENKGTIKAGQTTTATAMITKSGDLTNSGTIINSGTVMDSQSGTITNSGNISNEGTFSTWDEATLQTNTGTITNEGSVITNILGVLGYMTSQTTDGETTYTPATLTFTNSGTLTVNNGNAGVYVADGHLETDDDGNVTGKTESTLTFNNTGTITVNNTNGGPASGVMALNQATMTNDGSIILKSNGTDPVMMGMWADNGTLTNNKTIKIDAFDSTGGTAGNIAGMYVRKGEIINNGEIIINANNAYGMYVKYTTENWETPLEADDNTVYAQATNNGLIVINGENNIGMVADGKNAALTNKGTIEVKKPNVTDVFHKEGDEVTEAGTCSEFICLKNNAQYINSGTTTSAYAMNFDNWGEGRVVLGKDGVFEAPEISGNVIASADIVTRSNEEIYQTEKAFTGEDKGIVVDSGSYMFNASLVDNGDGSKDVVMERKNFNEVTDKASVADFLEQNYVNGNNSEFFDMLKSAGSAGSFSTLTTQNLGLDFFPNFAKQNLDVMKSLNRNINNTVLANADLKDERATVGYDNLHREQDGTSELAGYRDDVNTVYGIFDKKYDNNLRYGWGLSYSKFNSRYDRGGKRNENIIQVFAPIIYENNAYQFISTPRLGYGWGDYTRFGGAGVFSADIDSYYYGLANELRHEIDLEYLVFEPIFEFNILGLYQGSMKENKQLDIDSNNNLSVETGVGLYAKKTFKFGEDELRLRAGGTVYHEFGDPYATMKANMYGMSGEYNLNSYSVQRNRAVLSARAEYQHKQANIYGQFNKYLEDDGGYEVNAGLNWSF